MSKIEKINLSETVDYFNDSLKYFECEDDNGFLTGYEDIISEIKNATNTVKIISTTNIDNNLIDAIYQNNEINVYIVLKDFEDSKNTLERFSSKQPAILREVKSIVNNIIIIDDMSYIFIKSLSSNGNNSFCPFIFFIILDINLFLRIFENVNSSLLFLMAII